MAASLDAITKMDWEKMHDASVNITHNYLSAEIMSNQYQEIYSRLLEAGSQHLLKLIFTFMPTRIYRQGVTYRDECDWVL